MIDPNELQGREWLNGTLTVKGFKGLEEVRFHTKQIEFINNKNRSSLVSGGMASGKTLAFIVKFILLSQWFPNSNFLIGRKTQGNAEETFMKDFAKICPPDLYTHQKGYHKIVMNNGSTAEFWGLDALQSGAESDIKKAEQKLRSHNFNFVFLDQMEEIEFKVFNAIQTRMRASRCTHSQEYKTTHRDQQGNAIYEVCSYPNCGKYGFTQLVATVNPANFWGYDHFKVNPRPNTHLVEVSMLDNKQNLAPSFIENEMGKPELYKLRFVYGQWDDKSMVEGGVFAEEHILNQRAIVKPPLRVNGGIRIFEEPSPTEEYQIGVDPSSGAVDPCSITCISKTTGRVVATYTAHVPHKVVAEKAVQIAIMYSIKARPMIVPEGNDNTVVELLKPLWEEIYVREVYATIQDKKTSKLGFYTTHATKTQLIENMKALFASGFPQIYDEDHVNELNKFIYTDSASQKGAGAQEGYHDDRVMSTMLAYWKVPPTGFIDPKSVAVNKQKEIFMRNVGRSYKNSTK